MSYNDEDKAIRNFIIIFIIVIAIAVGLYFFTKNVVNKDEATKEEETKEVEIDNSVAIVGTMLRKVEEEYYVILYKSDDNDSYKYTSLVSKYKATGKNLPVYTVDLSNKLNEQYYDKDNVNLSAENITDLRFGDITVLKVEKGKIKKTYDSIEKIKKVWKIEED